MLKPFEGEGFLKEKSDYKQELGNLKFHHYAVRRSEKTPENCKFLRQRLRGIFAARNYGSKSQFIDDVHDFHSAATELKLSHFSKLFDINLDQSRLSTFLGDSTNADAQFNAETFKTIVLFLDFKKWLSVKHLGEEIVKDYPDPVFPAMLNFMSIGEYTLSNMKAQAPGLYKAYRPSSTFPGNYWVGALEIKLDDESDALVTREFYQSAKFDDRPNRIVTFEGYMLRKGRHYTILSRNEPSSSLCAALLPSVTIENGKIASLAGGVLDMSTGRLYGSRVFYERIMIETEEELEATPQEYKTARDKLFGEARVLSPDDMPSSLVHHFEFKHIDNITLY